MTDTRIRPLDKANPRERRQVLQLVYASQHHQHVELDPRDSPEQSRKSALGIWRWNLKQSDMRYDVYELNGESVGYVLLRELGGGRIGFIDDLFVAPEARGRGIGKKLVEHALAWAKDRGFEKMNLTTQRVNTAAAATYRAAGFEEIPSEYIDFELRLKR